MGDKPESLYLPERENSSLLRSPACSGIVARGRKDASALAARRKEVVYRAVVGIWKGDCSYDSEGDVKLPPMFYGVIDESGEFVVDPIYREIRSFSGGLAAFSLSATEGRLWGYLDHQGAVVISPSFEHASGFCEDLAAVSIDGKWGFIRKDGTWAIRPRYSDAGDFENGLAPVTVGQKRGLIDKSGEYAIEPWFEFVSSFSEGLAAAGLDGNLGYIGPDGTFAIPPRFELLENCYRSFDFQLGMAGVRLNGRDCLIDITGGVIFECRDGGFILDLNDGIALISEADGAHRYYFNSAIRKILGETTEVCEEYNVNTIDAYSGFSEGLGSVSAKFEWSCLGAEILVEKYSKTEGSRRCGYIDAHGQMRIPPKFADAWHFKEGLAAVRPFGAKKGFIDKDGELVIDAQFYGVGQFANDRAIVREPSGSIYLNRCGFIDRTGKTVVPCQFGSVRSFQKIKL